jgi:membrane protein implicated in regulation of membrane protease activity
LNLLLRVAGAVLGILLFVLAFVFASVIFAVVAVLALVLWACLLWRTRNLPKRGRGTVIEGEYRVEREVRRIDDDAR